MRSRTIARGSAMLLAIWTLLAPLNAEIGPNQMQMATCMRQLEESRVLGVGCFVSRYGYNFLVGVFRTLAGDYVVKRFFETAENVLRSPITQLTKRR